MAVSGSSGILYRHVLSWVAAESVPTQKAPRCKCKGGVFMSVQHHLSTINILCVTHSHSIGFPGLYQVFYTTVSLGLVLRLWKHLPMLTELPVVLARLCRTIPQEESVSLWITPWFRGVHGTKGAAKKGSADGHYLDLMLPVIKGSQDRGKRQKQLLTTAKDPPPILQQIQQAHNRSHRTRRLG